MLTEQSDLHYHAFSMSGIPEEVLAESRHAWPTGSSYTVNPPVLDTDRDWLVLVHDLETYAALLRRNGFVDCLTTDPDLKLAYAQDPSFGMGWIAFRKGVLNLICTASKDWFLRAVAATELCRALNVKEKEQRVRVFLNVRDGDYISLGGLHAVPLAEPVRPWHTITL